MRNKLLITFLMVLFCGVMYAQNSNENIAEGDVFKISKVENDNYKHINFPKANLIRKKGGLPYYDAIVNEQVEITSIKKMKDGSVLATIKMTSGKRFFNSHKYVTVAINEALTSKELMRL